MKNLVVSVIALWCFLPSGSCILTKMACSVSGNGTCADKFCFITPINSTVNAANFGCGNLTRQLDKINVKQKFYFKIFNDYILMDIFPEVEYCSFMKKPDKSSVFYKIVKTLHKKVPGLIHRCPYKGNDLQIRNLVVGASDIALWITGEYKIVYTFSDDLDKKIFQVSALGVIKRN